MKLQDIKVRCRSCDCFVEMDADSPLGTCHANPPTVVVVFTNPDQSIGDQLIGAGKSTVQTMTQKPATVFPLVAADTMFCSQHPAFDDEPAEPVPN